MKMGVAAYVSSVVLTCAWCVLSEARLEVPMTLVRNASEKGACKASNGEIILFYFILFF